VDITRYAGAGAVKFQTFTADALVTTTAPKAQYQRQTMGAAAAQFETLKRLELSRDAHAAVLDRCARRGIV
jgi:sialic acid synthase SpsE